MRRLLVIFGVLALVVPAASVAGRQDPGDGTFFLRGGHGSFTVSARGAVIGSFARGKVIITDPIDGDGNDPIVTGDEWQKEKSDTTTVYGGKGVRFRLIGGVFRIRVVATGVTLSVVGHGQVTLNGAGSADGDGSYSFNGAPYADVPDFGVFALNALSP